MVRLGIVGAGHVGSIVAYTVALRGLVDQVLIYDIDEAKVDSQLADLEDGNVFYPHPVSFFQASLEDLATCQINLVASGRPAESQDRLMEFDNNKRDVAEYVPQIMKAGFDGFFIVVTNPCDIISYQVWDYSGLAKERVIGSGTALDSVRSQGILARCLGISPRSVSAMTLGEHGDSQFLPWSQVWVGQLSLEAYLNQRPELRKVFHKEEIEKEAVYRGHRVFQGKGATQFGIANTVSDILSALVHDSKTCLNVSTLLTGQYGIDGIFISTPCIIGGSGVEKIIELDLTHEEVDKFHKSAQVIRKYVEKL